MSTEGGKKSKKFKKPKKKPARFFKVRSREKVLFKFAKLELVSKKIKIIAHGANSLEKIKKALADGADLVEIDVSKQVFTNHFVAQHQGILGKFGVGQDLKLILKKIPKEKVIFDIKHPQFTPSFAEKFDQLLKKFNFNKTNIVSDNWEVLVKLAKIGAYKIYFLVENDKNVHRLLSLKKQSGKINFGVSVAAKFLDKVDFSNLHKNHLKIFAGPINNLGQLQKVLSIEVEGVITDEAKKIAKFLKNLP